MGRWYTTRGAVKRSAGISGTDKDAIVDAHIEAASREIDAGVGADEDGVGGFIPITATRSYPWTQPNFRNSYTLMLDAPLISVSALTKEGDDVTAIAAADYFLEPVNLGPPYHWIEIDLASTAFFSAKDTHQRQIRVTGLWGHTNDTKAAGALAEADDGSETALDVTDSSLIDVGDSILIGSEQMFVSGAALLDTTANTNGALTADVTETSVTVTDGTKVKAGEVISINSEKMYVVSISGNVLTVIRSYDGSVLAAHSDAQDVYAPRTLTVARAQGGTTAATHDTAAAIVKYAPPADIEGLCRAMASAYWFAEQGGWTGMVGASAEANVETKHAALIRRKQRTLGRYQRRVIGVV